MVVTLAEQELLKTLVLHEMAACEMKSVSVLSVYVLYSVS